MTSGADRSDTVRVAAVQDCPVFLDRAATLDQVDELNAREHGDGWLLDGYSVIIMTAAPLPHPAIEPLPDPLPTGTGPPQRPEHQAAEVPGEPIASTKLRT